MSTVSSSEIPLITSSLVLVGTLICTILVDRFGRRRLLLVSISGIISSLGLLSLLFYIGSSSAGALLALAMYIVFHSLGIGTVPWIINSEIYPTKYRTICLAVANLVYWCSKMVVQDFLFDNLGQYLSVAQMLFLFCLFSAVVGLFIHFYIPETERLHLEDVEKILLEEEKCIKMDNCPREDEEPKDVIIAR
ncbi:hypothetical protein MKW94_012801 [Papaver nudicaule]|uniref:Major facilitator superfamily (MFS) profile domain-containing protein n=1 Tax=Papaver nudicaule TaxID=74823 RepID=A0AA41VC56_PAPNU|nr:hypothetical protein [Papaver nudicaule]